MQRTLTWMWQPRLVAVLLFVALLVARCDDFSTYPK